MRFKTKKSIIRFVLFILLYFLFALLACYRANFFLSSIGAFLLLSLHRYVFKRFELDCQNKTRLAVEFIVSFFKRVNFVFYILYL